ncbi:MAG TPA: gliding motility-associated C-terminal domain-containing protein, partial [Chitinophagales bacterium]|nr:gliding motility-associated C-terminal domain-containing protein [Chitinophagales bacterium]
GLIPYPNLPDDTTVCKGNYVGLTSQFGDHFQWTSSPSPTYLNCDTCKSVICSAPDTVTLFVTATTNIGCVASDTVKVNVDKLPPIFPGISYRVCLNDTLQLSAGANVTAATWTPNLFISDTNSVNPKVYPPDSMTYRVTGGNSTGCTISRIVKVYVIDKVVADLNIHDTLLCEAGVLPLDLTVLEASFNDTSYTWSPTQYLNAPNIQDPIVAPPPGDYNYTVIVRSSTCIPDTEMLHLVIAPNPVVQAGDDQTVTPGTTIQIYASSPDDVNYLWTEVDPMTCTNCRRPFLTATQNQTVYVRATNAYGCAGIDSVTIRVVDCDPESIYIPNTFTPNGDGINDLLLVRGIGLRKLEFFRVFDRWGKLVFETQNLNDGWNGEGPYGKAADVSTYVYVVSGVCSNGNSILKSGNVTLVR